eukprot:1156014-Pelagomonas_calceolata.AAC.8
MVEYAPAQRCTDVRESEEGLEKSGRAAGAIPEAMAHLCNALCHNMYLPVRQHPSSPFKPTVSGMRPHM